MSKADYLMKRWAWLIRRGLLVGHGYPTKSAYVERVAGSECYDIDMLNLTSEEKGTIAEMKAMGKKLNLIARFKWSQGYSHEAIARLLTSDKNKIDYCVIVIKQKVADAVLL